ncbi:hypothetical protein ACFVYJ_05315 [Pontibacter sp. JAM-7]|uniref:hypothetical protein n=1 Tax=Pontibacter sp. JAM-7 TaxID=3366581 RepID=UPI003AF5C86D
MNLWRGLVLSWLVAFAAPLYAAEATSFAEAFESNRAMYGRGHQFVWQGRQYTTTHPEEREAEQPATLANATVLLASAKAKNSEVAALGFEWKLTAGILQAAETALLSGDYQLAMHLAAQAKYHARMGIRQAHHANQHWLDAVPKTVPKTVPK